jgi:transketolase
MAVCARIGMRTFGAPAPIKGLLKKSGCTPENFLAAAKAQIANSRRQAE